MKIVRMVYKLEPFKDFILASEVKVDLGGQRSFFEKVEQFLGKRWCMLFSSSGDRRALNFHFGLKVKFDLRGQKLTIIVNLTREFDEDLVNIVQTIFELFTTLFLM